MGLPAAGASDAQGLGCRFVREVEEDFAGGYVGGGEGVAECGDGDGVGVGVEGGDDGVAAVVWIKCGVENVVSSHGEFGFPV